MSNPIVQAHFPARGRKNRRPELPDSLASLPLTWQISSRIVTPYTVSISGVPAESYCHMPRNGGGGPKSALPFSLQQADSFPGNGKCFTHKD